MPESQIESDKRLVRAINRGDADAFAELYRCHHGWVVSLAWRFTGDHELAQDVMQDVFCYLLTRFPGFRLTAQLRTYLYPVVRSTAATHLRKKKNHAGETVLLLLAGPPVEVADSEPAHLQSAIAALPDGQREVLLMRIVDEMHTAEIAAALQIPSGTVKSRLHNALKVLRQDTQLRTYFSDDP